MSGFVYKNNSNSLVVGTLLIGATTLNVTGGEGANFPSTFPFRLTLWDSAVYGNPGEDSDMEIVHATGRSTDALTIVRAQEGTADVEHAAGEKVAMLWTAGHFNDATYGVQTILDAHKANNGSEHSFIDQDVTNGSAPTFVGTNITAIPASNVEVNEIGNATYGDVQDWLNSIQSAGIIDGFELDNSRTALELDVLAGKGYIKSADSEIASTLSFDFAGQQNITLTADRTNYIYLDYNSGTPQILATVDRSLIELNRQFTLGAVYKNGTVLHIVNGGVHVSNLARTEHERLIARDGFTHISGTVTSEIGTLNLNITAGKWDRGHNPINTDALNTSVTGSWRYTHYGVASWIIDNATAATVDCTHYNSGVDLIAPLTVNAYGTQWVYISAKSDVYVIYGTENGSLATAQAATPPTSIPEYMSTLGELIAKIIVRQDGTISSIGITHGIIFSSSGVPNHNDTGNLNADNFKHLTEAEKTLFDTVEANAAADQTASEVPIVDSGAIITAVDVEGALQENRTAIDLNTAKETNVVYPAETATTIGALIGGSADAIPNDTDFVATSLTAAGILKKITWTNVKVFLKTYFDTLYNLYVHPNHTGDVTSVADGATTIVADAVTYAKIQNVSATDKLLGRSTAGAGDVEEIPCTAAGRAILDGVDAAAQVTTLGLDNAKTTPIFLPAEAAYLPQADFALTGTVTMTNASTAVTGSGTAFDTELQVNDYIKLDADTSTSWAKVASIESATGLTLSAVYGGTGGASAASGSGNPAEFGELLGTGRYMGWSVAKFDDTLTNPDGGERCGWRIFVPDYDGGDITLTGAMKPATTPSGAVTSILNIRTIGIATSEPFDSAITVDTGVDMTFSLNTTELDSDAVLATATINPANVAADDLMVLEVDIDPASTLVGDGELLYIMMEYEKV